MDDNQREDEAGNKLSGAELTRGAECADLVGAEGDYVSPHAHEADGKPGPACAVHLTAYGSTGCKAGGA